MSHEVYTITQADGSKKGLITLSADAGPAWHKLGSLFEGDKKPSEAGPYIPAYLWFTIGWQTSVSDQEQEQRLEAFRKRGEA